MIVYLIVVSQVVILSTAQTPNPQPCMICGGAVTRLWSLHSHVGDQYLRINPSVNVTGGLKVDFGGVINLDNDASTTDVDALVQFKDESTGYPDFETRVKITFYHNNEKYFLKAQGIHDELIAISESKANNLTDKSDEFLPIRLNFEHNLFFVFESVKHRNYYLASTGDAQTKLVNTHSEAYRDSETLIKLIDPGQAIAGASFGGVMSSRKKRRGPKGFKGLGMSKEVVELFPGKAYGKKIRSSIETDSSQIAARVRIPLLETFTLCFWIRTKDNAAQIFAMVYDRNSKSNRDKPTINISIRKGSIVIHLDGKENKAKDSEVNDGKWHNICVSLQDTDFMHIFKDGKERDQIKYKTDDKKLWKKRQLEQKKKQQYAFVFLGNHISDLEQSQGKKGKTKDKDNSLRGDLTQVNLWDDYPLFRIQRIATNAACGGGNIVQWKDFLEAANFYSENVQLYTCDDCPKQRGFNFNKKQQNQLV